MLKKTNMVTTAGPKKPSKSNSDAMRTLLSMASLTLPPTDTNKQLTTTSHDVHNPYINTFDPCPPQDVKGDIPYPRNSLVTTQTSQAHDAADTTPENPTLTTMTLAATTQNVHRVQSSLNTTQINLNIFVATPHIREIS